MKTFPWRIIVGVFLVLMGGLALLQTMHIFALQSLFWGLLISVLFIVVGLAFLVALFQSRANWWAAIPGCSLIGIGAVIGTSLLFPALSDVSGLLVLGGIGVGFWIVYFLNHKNWWAIIPGGVMLTLAGITVLGNHSAYTGGVLFLGMGVTFGLLAVLPTGERRMTWPWIPAAVLFIMGVALTFTSTNYENIAWAVMLILVGLFFLGRSFLKKGS